LQYKVFILLETKNTFEYLFKNQKTNNNISLKMTKKIQLICLIAILLALTSNAQTTVYSESFETDGFNTRYVMNRFSDGGQDYFGVVDANGNTQYITGNSLNPFTITMGNLDGTKCVGGEDFKRLDNPLNSVIGEYRGYFITKTVDVSSYANVEVHILLSCRFGDRYEGNENDAVRIQYAFDTNIANGANNLSPGLTNESTVNTGTYTDIGRFLANSPTNAFMQQDTNLDGSPDGPLLNNTMTEYVFIIPVTGTNLSVRINLDYDDSAEEMAFDFLRLIGTGTPSSPPVPDTSSLPNVNAECEVTSLTAPTADSGAITGTHNATLPITAQGTTVVIWTYTNANSQTTTQNQNVVIDDVTDPIPDAMSLADVTAECEVTSLTAPTATDNCGGSVTITNATTFPIMATTIVVWTYDDGNGNSVTQNQNVTITAIDNSVTEVAGVLTANAIGYSYQWIDCDNGNTPIVGETGQSLTVTYNSSYAVQISDGTCTETSVCTTVNVISVPDNNFGDAFSSYPNPTEGEYTINLGHTYNDINISVRNILGQLISNTHYDSADIINLSLKGASGTYFIKIHNSDGKVANLKILKK
jgi:hypothetical protein